MSILHRRPKVRGPEYPDCFCYACVIRRGRYAHRDLDYMIHELRLLRTSVAYQILVGRRKGRARG